MAKKRLARSGAPRRRITRRPEQALQIHVATALRWMPPDCLWFSVPNEGRRGIVAAAMLKRMGLRAGIADMVFLWGSGCGLIELKAPGKVQSDNQRAIEAECRVWGIPYEVCWSLDHVIEVLVRWGRLPADSLQRIRGISFSPPPGSIPLQVAGVEQHTSISVITRRREKIVFNPDRAPMSRPKGHKMKMG